jgi:AraC-like DNA-binding protein
LKSISFHIPKPQKEVFRVQVDQLPYFFDRLHQHNELQITLIERGSGTLVAGDYVGRFGAGDVFVVGKQLPHVFRCDDTFYHTQEGVLGISVFFDESYAGDTFWENEELRLARDWLVESGQGYRVTGTTAAELGQSLRTIRQENGLQKLINGFEILRLLSESTELVRLSIREGGRFPKEVPGNRMDKIMNFTFSEMHRPVGIEEVAALVSLTPSAFCRYFKQRTRKTYLTFINEIRISQACRLLATTDLPISDISFRVGFHNLSHFNQYFKKIKACTPSVYRQLYEQ